MDSILHTVVHFNAKAFAVLFLTSPMMSTGINHASYLIMRAVRILNGAIYMQGSKEVVQLPRLVYFSSRGVSASIRMWLVLLVRMRVTFAS